MICLTRATAVAAGVLALVTLGAVDAHAQYGRPLVNDPPLGEKYRVEASISFWNPSLDSVISSDSLNIGGTDIDVKSDLGYGDKSIREFRFVFRPFRKHKLRVAYTPTSQSSDRVLQRALVFNGVTYNVGLPVQSDLAWNTWRFGYEYDFIYRDRGYFGVILEGRHVDAEFDLRSPVATEFTRAKGFVPALGVVGRAYVHKRVSITGEITGMSVPEIDNYKGSFFDFDIYGTVSLNHYLGGRFGFRSLDASYEAEQEQGDLTLKGVYFSIVARF